MADMFPDPLTAHRSIIEGRLVELQRQFRVASHEVAENGVVPDGCDDSTLRWWVYAWETLQKARWTL